MQNTHWEVNSMLGENLLFFSTALMIHLVRQSTRLAAEVAGWWWRSSTSLDHHRRSLQLRSSPRWLLHWRTRNQQIHINSEVTGASFPYFKHSRPRRRRRAQLPNARTCCCPHGNSAHLSAPPRWAALPSQHIPEICNAASLVLGMLVLPVLQVHLLLLCLGHLLCLWLLLDVSHSALLWHISV